MLHRVFTAVCRAKALPSVIDCVAHLAAEQRSKLWQRLRIGISYAVARGRAPELTLFLDSGQLFRDDLQARTRILGLLNQLGQPMPVYENFTSRLAERPPSVPVHGLVGLKAADSGRIDCSVGVRPFA
jgi:hypothetical protein